MTATTSQAATEKIEDPIHRVAYSFERDGDNLWVHTQMEDGGHLPEHFHPVQEERWEVVEGAASLKLDGTHRSRQSNDAKARSNSRRR